jgi:hypothetical protein
MRVLSKRPQIIRSQALLQTASEHLGEPNKTTAFSCNGRPVDLNSSGSRAALPWSSQHEPSDLQLILLDQQQDQLQMTQQSLFRLLALSCKL